MLFMRILNIEYVHKISNLSAQVELIVHFFILYLVIKIYKKSNKADKEILKWFVIACIGLFLNDLAFYFVVYLPKNYLIDISSANFIFDMIPFSIWVFAIIIFLSKVIINNIYNVRQFIRILSIFIILNFIVTFLCLSSIKYAAGLFSWEDILQILSYVAESLIFDFSILCLIYSENSGLSFILSGLIILISGDFFIDYLYISQTSLFESYGELLWFLGLIFILFGVLIIEKKNSYSIRDWLRKVNTIKSKLAFWAFGISIINILPIFILAYCFSLVSRSVFLTLPLFLMIYSMIIVNSSLFIGRHFEIPFRKIVNNVKVLMSESNKEKIDHQFHIEEFIFLQNFIADAFKVKEEKDQIQIQLNEEKDSAQKKMEQVTAQVAHDIRSPLSALEVIIKRLPNIEESYQILLRDAITHIRDITNNLELNAFKNRISEAKANTQIAILLEYVLSERRATLSNQSIKINQLFKVDAYGFFINVVPSVMRRILTNILNNACEVLLINGVIEVNVEQVAGKIIITITDNGPGISKKIMPSLFTRGFTTKTNGSGLGLYYAKESLAEWGGMIELNSEVGHGTSVSISLPAMNPPHWFIDQLIFNHHDTVICVDDNISILHSWQERFKSMDANVDLIFCNNKENFLLEMDKLANKACVFLIDYEFPGKSYTGLDLIEMIFSAGRIDERIYLVTSRSTEEKIQKFCQEKNIRIIPKFFVPKIPLRVVKTSVDKNLLIDLPPELDGQ